MDEAPIPLRPNDTEMESNPPMTSLQKIVSWFIRFWPGLALIVLGIVGFNFFFSLNAVFEDPSPLEPGIRVDAIVVLAGGKGRIEYGLKLHDEDIGKKVLIAGVGPKFTLESYLGAPPKESWDKNVKIDNLSTSTIENGYIALSFVKKYKLKSFLLVTSDYHLKRAYVVFKRIFPPEVTIKTTPIPSEIVTEDNWWQSSVGFKLVFFEWIKWIRTKFFFRPWEIEN